MKKYTWSFFIGEDEMSGGSDTWEQAVKDMAIAGYDGDDFDTIIQETSDEAMVAAARDAANPPRPKSTVQNLAEANTHLFNQVDGLKNKIAELERRCESALFERRMFYNIAAGVNAFVLDIRELIFAWNTEQHARLGAAHIEPTFVTLLREYATNKALQSLEKESPNVEEEEKPGEKTLALPRGEIPA